MCFFFLVQSEEEGPMADESAWRPKESGVKRRMSLEGHVLDEPPFSLLAFMGDYVKEQAREMGMSTESIDQLSLSDVEGELFPSVVGQIRS